MAKIKKSPIAKVKAMRLLNTLAELFIEGCKRLQIALIFNYLDFISRRRPTPETKKASKRKPNGICHYNLISSGGTFLPKVAVAINGPVT
jgi:hypothetical protein